MDYKDLKYKWDNGADSLQMSENIVLPQFEIKKVLLTEKIIGSSTGKKLY